jgi:hypothetical protein
MRICIKNRWPGAEKWIPVTVVSKPRKTEGTTENGRNGFAIF